MSGVTVVIPTIPFRTADLAEALITVSCQTEQAVRVVVQVDEEGAGAGPTRNLALERVDTEWVAFLDDDDLFLPWHLARLREAAEESGADVVYPWFHTDGTDPLGRFGEPFDPVLLRSANYIPVTVLARVGLIRRVGGFEPPPWYSGSGPTCEDWGLWVKLVAAGARFVHLPERTWVWRRDEHSTGGCSWQDPELSRA